MKHLILLIFLCLPFTSVDAGWFSKTPDPLIEAKATIVSLENKLTAQSIILNRWQITSGSLALGCVILLIIGAALGSRTRTYHYESTRRLGPTRSTPPPSTLNGRKPTILGEDDQDNVHQTLAA